MSGVKVRLDEETIPSVISELLTSIVTSAVGWLLSFTVKVAVSPASVVLPLIGPIENPAFAKFTIRGFS